MEHYVKVALIIAAGIIAARVVHKFFPVTGASAAPVAG